MDTDALSKLIEEKEAEQSKLWGEYEYHMAECQEKFSAYLELTGELGQLRIDQYAELLKERGKNV